MSNEVYYHYRLSPETAEFYAGVLRCLGNPTRLKILSVLADREYCAVGLAAALGLSQTVISDHLAQLRSRELLQTYRRGTRVYYKCSDPCVLRFLGTLGDILSS
jgi:ArsR family transcriptional regulator